MIGQPVQHCSGERPRHAYRVRDVDGVDHGRNVVHPHDMRAQQHRRGDRGRRRHVPLVRCADRRERRSGTTCARDRPGAGSPAPQAPAARPARHSCGPAASRTQPGIENDGLAAHAGSDRAFEARTQLIRRLPAAPTRSAPRDTCPSSVRGHASGSSPAPARAAIFCESRIISQAGHVVDERGAFRKRDFCHRGLRRVD